jgi:ubiquitin-activating enzyme E1 C
VLDAAILSRSPVLLISHSCAIVSRASPTTPLLSSASIRFAGAGIEGVTYFKTMGVVKNIIPAVASTNAIISAMCVNEALKLVTFGSQTVNNYFMYMGGEGLYTPTFTYEKSAHCVVCSDEAATRRMAVSGDLSLQAFMGMLKEAPSLQLSKPSLIGESTSLYMQKPPSLEAVLRANLSKPLSALVRDGEVITVTDPTLREVSLSIQLDFTNTPTE